MSFYEIFKKKTKSYIRSEIDLSLNRLKTFLKYLNNPQEKLCCIHVAGTNGKGSVCSMLSFILKEAGYKTGLFISPHIKDFTERIQINNTEIDSKKVLEILNKIEPVLLKLKDNNGIYLTEFELTCAIAFIYFSENHCDFVVLETGLGGRLDATNIIKKPIMTVITSISKDHTNILGTTLEKIAQEKAGIIKPSTPVVCSTHIKNNALNVIKKVTEGKKSEIIFFKGRIEVIEETYHHSLIRNGGNTYKLNLAGTHQIINVKTVFTCVDYLTKIGYKISQEAVKNALQKVNHQARLEILSTSPITILDGAHNEEGITALLEFILKHFKNKKIYGIFGALKDKFFGESLSEIFKIFEHLIVLEVDNKRTFKKKDLYQLINRHNKNVTVAKNVYDSFEKAGKLAKKDDIIIIFGSLYLAGEIKSLITKLKKSKWCFTNNFLM